MKAGLLSFGGAYTAIPFLQASMVGHYAAITPSSFLDGIALASIIPAPLVIFGTYLGFLAGGLCGALLITLGIFLPAFLFTILGHKQIEKVVENKTLHSLLDGIGSGVVGMLVITALQIFLHNINGTLPAIIFAVAMTGFYFWKHRLSVPVVILACGVFGYLIELYRI